MNTITLLWTVWAAMSIAVTALMVYRGLLTRAEEDQIFLDENILGEEQRRQKDIVEKLHFLKPLVTVAGGGAIATSAALLGIYVLNAIQVLRAG